jgi:ubiquitin carboxyl-terminal hydrolase 8
MEYKNKGLTGLVNLGNTCFMNSAIQCLSNTIKLTDYFNTKEFANDINKNYKHIQLAYQWHRLLKGIWESNCIVSPTSFHKTIRELSEEMGYINFTGFNQNDTQEFLILMIDTLHESLSREVKITISGKVKNKQDKMALNAMKNWKTHFKSSYSKIIELFYGQLVSSIYTMDDELLSESFDPICMFDLPIPQKEAAPITLYDCFDLYTDGEVLDGDNQYKNDKTGEHIDAKKKIQIWTFPEILIISLKRFSVNGFRLNKRNDIVDIPIDNLNLGKYCVGYTKNKSKYELYGVCNHSGGLGGGHYFAFCKNPNGNWYSYNDNFVKKIESESVITNMAYVLFYKRK